MSYGRVPGMEKKGEVEKNKRGKVSGKKAGKKQGDKKGWKRGRAGKEKTAEGNKREVGVIRE